jgi:hypothetical protein
MRCRVELRADDVKVEFDPDTREWRFVRDDWKASDLTEDELFYVQAVVDREAEIARHQYSREEIAEHGYRLESGSVLMPGPVMVEYIRRGLAKFRWA